MSTEKRIKDKEIELSATNDLLNLFDANGITGSARQLIENKLTEIEKSLEHDRKIQELETRKSGREMSWGDVAKYVVAFSLGAIFIEIVKWILSKI